MATLERVSLLWPNTTTHDTVALVWLIYQKTRESPLSLSPPNEEMHYDVISFGPAKKLPRITEPSE